MAELSEALDAFAPGRSCRRRSGKVTNAQLGANNHCALKLLSGSPDGCTGALMLALGITRDLLAELILDGLESMPALAAVLR
jgi:hypothetical protein